MAQRSEALESMQDMTTLLAGHLPVNPPIPLYNLSNYPGTSGARHTALGLTSWNLQKGKDGHDLTLP